MSQAAAARILAGELGASADSLKVDISRYEADMVEPSETRLDAMLSLYGADTDSRCAQDLMAEVGPALGRVVERYGAERVTTSLVRLVALLGAVRPVLRRS